MVSEEKIFLFFSHLMVQFDNERVARESNLGVAQSDIEDGAIDRSTKRGDRGVTNKGKQVTKRCSYLC